MATDTKEAATATEKDADLTAPKLNDLAPKDDAPVESAEPAEAPADDTIKDVLYIGQASLRTISSEDWLSLGIRDEAAVEWNTANGYRVPAEEFSTEAVRHLIRVDGSFQLVAAEVEDDI